MRISSAVIPPCDPRCRSVCPSTFTIDAERSRSRSTTTSPMRRRAITGSPRPNSPGVDQLVAIEQRHETRPLAIDVLAHLLRMIGVQEHQARFARGRIAQETPQLFVADDVQHLVRIRRRMSMVRGEKDERVASRSDPRARTAARCRRSWPLSRPRHCGDRRDARPCRCPTSTRRRTRDAARRAERAGARPSSTERHIRGRSPRPRASVSSPPIGRSRARRRTTRCRAREAALWMEGTSTNRSGSTAGSSKYEPRRLIAGPQRSIAVTCANSSSQMK